MKKIGLICLAVVLALGGLGLGYAHWSDQLYINADVEAGSLTLAFDFVEPPSCQEGYYNAAGQIVWGEYLDKEVGSCDAWYEDYVEDVHTLKPGYKRLVIEVTNAYPQYRVHTTFKLHNIGTIPLDITEYIITGEKRDSLGVVVYDLLWYDPDEDWIGSLYEDVNDNGVVDLGVDLEVINLEITNALPYQIDPCWTNKAQIDLEFKQDMEECHTYTIDVVIVAVQWSKA